MNVIDALEVWIVAHPWLAVFIAFMVGATTQ